MAKPTNITTLKSPKSALIKKTLIVAAAAAGLILAGAIAFVAVQPEETETDSE